MRWTPFLRHSVPAAAVRTRFAPSPTGYLHLGGLRTALFNALLARKEKGQLLLRIEDTDQTRIVPDAADKFVEVLKWTGIEFDEGPHLKEQSTLGPYVQSERLESYRQVVEQLVEDKKAYRCFCSSERLASVRSRLTAEAGARGTTYDRACLHLSSSDVSSRLAAGEKHVVRFKSSTDPVVQEDLVYATIRHASPALDDFILLKSDGFPTYHLASVCDDHAMKISHVMRGEEWLPSVPKHLALYKALGWAPPKLAHLPLLVNKDGSKLSKRQGDVSVSAYKDNGFEPEAVVNWVALAGWSPQHGQVQGGDEGTVEDVMTLAELGEKFTLEGVNKARATLSQDKLRFLNRAHVQRKLEEGGPKRQELLERLGRIVKESSELGAGLEEGVLEPVYLLGVANALKERLHLLSDVLSLGPYFFVPPSLSSTEASSIRSRLADGPYAAALTSARDVLSKQETWSEEAVKAALKEVTEMSKEKGAKKELMPALRHALTGQKVGATVASVIQVLGKERTLRRLEAALSQLA